MAQEKKAVKVKLSKRQKAFKVQQGKTYYVRSRQFGELGVVCVRYAKVTPVAVVPAAGTVTLLVTTNVGCNDRRLKD